MTDYALLYDILLQPVVSKKLRDDGAKFLTFMGGVTVRYSGSTFFVSEELVWGYLLIKTPADVGPDMEWFGNCRDVFSRKFDTSDKPVRQRLEAWLRDQPTPD